MALYLGLVILRKIGTDSYSINALLAPLLLGFICMFVALGWRSSPGRERAAWVAAWVGGCCLGFTILIRLPMLFLLPGCLILLWPRAWRPSRRDLLLPFGLGVILAGVVPLILHQHYMTGAWYLPTYGSSDSAPPDLQALWPNLDYYLGRGHGGQYNWALVAIAVGVAGLIAHRRRQVLAGVDLSWRRLLVSALALWGVPTIYFLTHRITIAYYAIPATFGAVLLVALGALTIECCAPMLGRAVPHARARSLRWLAVALALVPGMVTLIPTGLAFARGVVPIEKPVHQFVLPDELSVDHAWIWADLLSGTFWYYGRKPAFKIGFSIPEARALLYRFVFERGDSQYLVHDSPSMQDIMQEISHMGGRLERRGEVGGYPYFLILWPDSGPVYPPSPAGSLPIK
jgi:hypothetical protein